MTDIVVAVIAVLAGVLMCFEGYKLFRLSLGIAGGVAGFILGKIIISMTSNMGMSWNYISKSVVLLLFTVGLGILAFTLYMKALIAITTIVCAFWFYDDFSFLFAKIEGFTAYVGAKIISGVLAPLIWAGVSSGEYAGIIEQRVIGGDISMSYALIRVVVLVAFCAAGFAIQLKTSRK